MVDVDELSKVFGRLKIPVTREQVEELLQDVVVSGKVNVIALIESLQVKRDPRAPDVQEALDRCAAPLFPVVSVGRGVPST